MGTRQGIECGVHASDLFSRRILIYALTHVEFYASAGRGSTATRARLTTIGAPLSWNRSQGTRSATPLPNLTGDADAVRDEFESELPMRRTGQTEAGRPASGPASSKRPTSRSLGGFMERRPVRSGPLPYSTLLQPFPIPKASASWRFRP